MIIKEKFRFEKKNPSFKERRYVSIFTKNLSIERKNMSRHNFSLRWDIQYPIVCSRRLLEF